MKDSIQIIITRNCNDDGSSGVVADSATALLPTGQLDTLLDSFESAYGLHKADDGNGNLVEVSKERNYAVRVRKFSEEVLSAYVIDQQKKLASDQAKLAVEQQLGQISII